MCFFVCKLLIYSTLINRYQLLLVWKCVIPWAIYLVLTGLLPFWFACWPGWRYLYCECSGSVFYISYRCMYLTYPSDMVLYVRYILSQYRSHTVQTLIVQVHYSSEANFYAYEWINKHLVIVQHTYKRAVHCFQS